MGFQYCTYFDSNYFLRGLALYHSLRKHEPDAVLWILCLDEATHANLTRLGLPGLVPVPQAALEAEDPELLAVKPGRTKVEYYWSSGPSWLRYVMKRNPEAPGVVYLDGDLFLFAPLAPVFREFGGNSILIHEHRFTENAEKLNESQGRFNVGVMIFRNDANGKACLDWWRERCIEWCFMRNEPGRFGDQKYLDRFPELFQGVFILTHPGVGTASWNVGRHRVHFRGGEARIDDHPLIVYHFQGIHVLNPSLILNFGTRRITPGIRAAFSRYARAVHDAWSDCERKGIAVRRNQLDAKWKLDAPGVAKALIAGRFVFRHAFLTQLFGFPGALLLRASRALRGEA